MLLSLLGMHIQNRLIKVLEMIKYHVRLAAHHISNTSTYGKTVGSLEKLKYLEDMESLEPE